MLLGLIIALHWIDINKLFHKHSLHKFIALEKFMRNLLDKDATWGTSHAGRGVWGSGKVAATQVEGWVFDPRPMRELP